MNGKKEGKGKFTWADGKHYDGHFHEGFMDGHGTLTKN